MRNILRKVFYFKIKKINLKNNKMSETKYRAKQNKTKSPSKFFFTTEQTKVVRRGPIIIIF